MRTDELDAEKLAHEATGFSALRVAGLILLSLAVLAVGPILFFAFVPSGIERLLGIVPVVFVSLASLVLAFPVPIAIALKKGSSYAQLLWYLLAAGATSAVLNGILVADLR